MKGFYRVTVRVNGFEYEFDTKSDGQRILLNGYLFRYLDYDKRDSDEKDNFEWDVITPNGNLHHVVRPAGLQRRRYIIIEYPDKPTLRFLMSTFEDMDMLYSVLKPCTAGQCVTIRQLVQFQDRVEEREPGCMFRESVVTDLKEMEKDDLNNLMAIYGKYKDYLSRILGTDRLVFLAAIGVGT